MSLVKSSIVVGVLTMLSRIFGYVRDVLIASKIGAGPVSDAFFVAFRLPNLFRALFAEGAFNAAFVPVFSKIKDPDEAKFFAANIFSIMLIFLIAVVTLAQIFMPAMVWALASGFEDDAEKFALAVDLTRITFFYLLFISLVSLLGGVLNSLSKFAAFASAPILLNASMVTGLYFFSNEVETPAHALSWGIFVAGILQFIWLYAFCVKHGYRIIPKMPKLTPNTKEMFKKMLPVIIGAGVLQINLVINTQIASYLQDGAISFLYYADRLSQLPLALIGTAMGTVLLPTLSRYYGDKNLDQASRTQNRAFEFSWLLGLPAAVGLAILAEPITQLLFERGEFTESDTQLVSSALVAYACGIPAFILVKIFIVPYYASGDTSTPVKIGVLCIFVNLATSLSLINYTDIGYLALAISTSVSSWVNIVLLIAILKIKGIYSFQKANFSYAAMGLIASVAMAFTALFTVGFFEHQLLSVAVAITAGGLVYGLIAMMLGILRLREFLK